MNDDIILKYLADALSDKEKKEFEAALENDALAKERFEEMRRKFASIRELANVEPNGAYFNSIDAASILNAKKKTSAKKGFAFAASFAVILLIFFIVKGSLKTESDKFMFSEEELRIVERLTETELNAHVTLLDFPKLDFENLSENFDEVLLYDNIDDSAMEFYRNYANPEAYIVANAGLSDEDFASALNEISNAKF